jgi:ribonucleoside-diphosphate reductase alpha chain
MTPFGNMHVNLSIDPASERELEVFAHLGKGGDLASSDLEGMCRLASLYLRVGGQIEEIISQLDGIGSSLQVATKEGRIQSLADGLARALKKYLQAKTTCGLQSLLQGETELSSLSQTLRKEAAGDSIIEGYKIKCPVCGLQLCFEEGCTKCYGCGYSHC